MAHAVSSSASTGPLPVLRHRPPRSLIWSCCKQSMYTILFLSATTPRPRESVPPARRASAQRAACVAHMLTEPNILRRL